MTGSQAMNSLVPITGSTSSGDTGTPCARASQPAAADRSRGVPQVAGYPGASDAAASASRIKPGTGSTGVRMEPGFLGQRRDPVPGEGGKPARERHSSALMPAGSAATTGWSLPVLPVLEAPPGER